MQPQSATLERETVYSLLSDSVREYLLCYLSVVERTTTSEAAERIAAWKRETAVGTTDDVSSAVTIELVHNHLPRLDQHDVIDYDRSAEEITPGSNFEDVEPYVADLDVPLEPQ